jgi:hypothetical protein
MQARNGLARPLTIGCAHFSDADKAALRSMLGLLEPYLKHPWAIGEAEPFDLWLVNMDAANAADHVPAMEGEIVRCAARPKDHSQQAIHRPLRPHEVLMVLSEAAQRLLVVQDDGAALVQGNVAIRLRRWPLDFEAWPRSWWRVVACVARSTCSTRDIAERTGVPVDEVKVCVRRLIAEQWVDIVAQRAEETPARPGFRQKWSALATRLFKKFGLSR